MSNAWILRRSDKGRQSFLRQTLCLLLIFVVAGCTPALYSIDLKYAGTVEPLPAAWQQKFIMTVALFNDARTGGEDLLIGRVVTSRGGATKVIPRTMSPTAAVSDITKDILVKYGYQVSVAKPQWDLRPDSLRKEWGRIVVGGSVEQMEVVCQNDIPIKTYEAIVRLTLVVADTNTGKIIHRMSTMSKNSLEHIYFSEELLGRQLSAAIGEAVENALEGPVLKEKIKNILK